MDHPTVASVLPHRYPFLLVDRVVEISAGKRIVALKNVTINEPFFVGHFPDHPLMPGVLICEAVVQAGGILGPFVPSILPRSPPPRRRTGWRC